MRRVACNASGALRASFDGFAPSEVDVSGRDVVQALMVTMVVVVIDEGLDLGFEIAGQEVVFQQDAVLECLVPPLDFALRLRMIWGTARMLHTLVLQPVSQIARNVTGPIVAEQARFMDNVDHPGPVAV